MTKSERAAYDAENRTTPSRENLEAWLKSIEVQKAKIQEQLQKVQDNVAQFCDSNDRGKITDKTINFATAQIL